MKYLVDADVLSEATKPAPVKCVVDWLKQNESELIINPIVLGEVEYGILVLPSGQKRTSLERWFESVVRRIRVADFDASAASVWAHLLLRMKKQGVVLPVKDSLIAATALAHGLAVATRNTAHFAGTGVTVLNPFEP